jgi:hypothetical protein
MTPKLNEGLASVSWMVKTDSSGNIQWNKTYDGGCSESVVQNADGQYTIASFGSSKNQLGKGITLIIQTDSFGNPEWTKTFEGTTANEASCIIRTNDGGLALSGNVKTEAGDYDGLLIKTDSDGNIQWNQTYGGPKNDYLGAVVQNSDGGYTLAGCTNSSGSLANTLWVVRVDGNGQILEEPLSSNGLPIISIAVGVVILIIVAITAIFIVKRGVIKAPI